MTVTSTLLARHSGVFHGFTGRTDGGGTPLDLGTGANAQAWSRAATAIGADGCATAFASQVHGRGVRTVCGGGHAGEADALVSETPGLLLAVRVADCVPILVVGPGVVAAVHAGWRGLAAGVIGAAIEAMGTTGPLAAAVGPRICEDCYEVGLEVVVGIGALVPEDVFVRTDHPRPRVDLGAAAAHQLRAAGVADVDVLDICTRCESALWSHRQAGAQAGRQAGIVGLRC